MKNLLKLIGWLIALAILAKAGLWAWDNFTNDSRPAPRQQVLDIDKDCRMDADSGSCICRHRQTGERLKIDYSECVSLARGN
jgi:hypothetical protein